MPTAKAAAWRRLRLLITVIAVASFVLLMPSRFTSPARILFNEAVGPAQTAVFQATGRGLAATGTLGEMFRKADRERALAAEVARLRNANAALADELRRQQLRLDSVANLDVKRLRFRAVQAPVSSYDSRAMPRSITVRTGRTDGVAPGMAATSRGALVGVVVEAGPWQSRIRLITDPRSAIPCRLSRVRSLCILQGTGGEACLVDWVHRDAFAEPGDVVVTASVELDLEGRLTVPDGLPAATLTRVEQDAMRPLFLAVEAAPRVNVNRLESVEVLVPEP